MNYWLDSTLWGQMNTYTVGRYSSGNVFVV